ncbi:MAG: hypothetical protein RL456_3205 [Pseudomonadota bacterium]|jgi:hypothetical protein
MDALALYAAQMRAARGVRDRHLADVDAAMAAWRPRQDVPPIAWHAAHASLFTAITLCGMGRGDWSFADEAEIATYNFQAPVPGSLPEWAALRRRIAAWDAAGDAVAAALPPGGLAATLPYRRAEWLPESCLTWADALAYMAIHEPFHHGEIGLLRRLAGQARVE